MNTTASIAGHAPSGDPPRRGAVGKLVAERAARLAGSRERSSSVAAFAHLRANVNREPGIDGSIWGITIDGVPGYPRSDEPTREELAVHTALTLFAVHQQGVGEDMHRVGVGLGQAVRRLDDVTGGGSDDTTSPVRRRFNALVTAETLSEVRNHLRGLITQLRARGIALDYGMLADDICQFEWPGQADSVRRRWARQYHRLLSASAEQPDNQDDKTTTEEDQ